MLHVMVTFVADSMFLFGRLILYFRHAKCRKKVKVLNPDEYNIIKNRQVGLYDDKNVIDRKQYKTERERDNT